MTERFDWQQRIVLTVVTPEPERRGVGYSGFTTAYSCDDDYRNPMWPCGPFRNGEWHYEVAGATFACPYEWLNRRVEVEGYGVGVCRDTPRTQWYGSSPHIDILMGYEAAVRWGVQKGLRVTLLE